MSIRSLIGYSWVLLFFGGEHRATADDIIATLKNGLTIGGQLVGAKARELVFVSQGKRVPLSEISRLEFPAHSVILAEDQPARVFHLITGESITGELLQFSDRELTLRTHGNRLLLPRGSVLAIDHLQGETQYLFENLGGPQLSNSWVSHGKHTFSKIDERSAIHVESNSTLTLPISEPLKSVRLSLKFYDGEPDSQNTVQSVEFDFGTKGRRDVLRVDLASSMPTITARQSAPLRLIQPIPRQAKWRTLTLLSDDTRFQVLIDSHLLASGRAQPTPLHSVRIVTEAVATDNLAESSGCWFNSVGLFELHDRQVDLGKISVERTAQVTLSTDDVVFGELKSLDATQVQLTGAFGALNLAWNRIRRVVLAESKHQPFSTPTKHVSPLGWQAELTCKRWVDHPKQPGDAMSVTLLGCDSESIKLAHPLLGTLDVPFEQIDALELTYFGRRQLLFSDKLHLGNQNRAGFRHPLALGTQYSGEFSWAADVDGHKSVFLGMAVAELEPAGPETPLGSRYLSELRRGLLGTELLLNGEPVARINDAITLRSPVETPEFLRFQIPSDLLKAGTNTWKLRQTSLGKTGQEYDDCEIGPIWLETEESLQK